MELSRILPLQVWSNKSYGNEGVHHTPLIYLTKASWTDAV